MRHRFHDSHRVRELVILIDIYIHSVRFNELCKMGSFLMTYYQFAALTRPLQQGNAQNEVANFIEEFRPTYMEEEEGLNETVEGVLKDFLDAIIIKVIKTTSLEYCVVLLNQMLKKSTKLEFFLFLDSAPLDNATKTQLAKLFELLTASFEYYNIEQILKLMCKVESLRSSADEIETIPASQSISEISRYLDQLFRKLLDKLRNDQNVDQALVTRIGLRECSIANSDWRADLENRASTIEPFLIVQRNQNTGFALNALRNGDENKLSAYCSDEFILNINFALREQPRNQTILEEAESRDRDHSMYRKLLFVAARQVLLAEANDQPAIALETKRAIPDLLYRIQVEAETEEEKALILQLTKGALSYEDIEDLSENQGLSSGRAIYWLNRFVGDAEQARRANVAWARGLKWEFIELAKAGICDVKDFITDCKKYRSDIVNKFYSIEGLNRCARLQVSPCRLLQIFVDEDAELYQLIISPVFQPYFDNKGKIEHIFKCYHDSKKMFELLIKEGKIRPELLVCMKAGYDLNDVMESVIAQPEDNLYSEKMQSLLKIGATKNIVELLRRYKPLMLKSLLSKANSAEQENKKFSDIYFGQGRGFMNPRSNLLPVIAGLGPRLWGTNSFAASLARSIDRAISHPDDLNELGI